MPFGWSCLILFIIITIILKKKIFFNYLTPGSGNVAVNELHIGGSEGDDAIGVEDVARIDGHDDAQYRHQNTETAETHNFHR